MLSRWCEGPSCRVVQLGRGVNVFFGENGSGKTSLLEAVHILSCGRSFRTRNLASVISFSSDRCTCFGLLHQASGGVASVGVSREKGGDFLFKLSGEVVRSAAQLSDTLPVILLNNDSFQLLEGAPAFRRAFVDWGVFHVEHSFRGAWSRFQRCLKHRNSLLRHDRIDRLQMDVWDREFSAAGEMVGHCRERYLERLRPVVETVCRQMGLNLDISLSYNRGWPEGGELNALLREHLPRDQKMGFTHYGPHRADIKVRVDQKPAAEVLSRGQKKIVVTALKIAQGYAFQADNPGRHCLYLIDDLPAELDRSHRKAVASLLQDLGAQVLVTGVDRDELLAGWPHEPFGEQDMRVFHVEHGSVVTA